MPGAIRTLSNQASSTITRGPQETRSPILFLVPRHCIYLNSESLKNLWMLPVRGVLHPKILFKFYKNCRRPRLPEIRPRDLNKTKIRSVVLSYLFKLYNERLSFNSLIRRGLFPELIKLKIHRRTRREVVGWLRKAI